MARKKYVRPFRVPPLQLPAGHPSLPQHALPSDAHSVSFGHFFAAGFPVERIDLRVLGR